MSAAATWVLWEQQIERVLAFDRPEELHVYSPAVHTTRAPPPRLALLAAPLAARGTKVGVLMGTAYVATAEAVLTGAITPELQQQVLHASGTTLIETVPGHTVSCLRAGFVETFDREKARLRAQGLGSHEVWASLESFSVGRLRMATRGSRATAPCLLPSMRRCSVAKACT